MNLEAMDAFGNVTNTTSMDEVINDDCGMCNLN